MLIGQKDFLTCQHFNFPKKSLLSFDNVWNIEGDFLRSGEDVVCLKDGNYTFNFKKNSDSVSNRTQLIVNDDSIVNLYFDIFLNESSDYVEHKLILNFDAHKNAQVNIVVVIHGNPENTGLSLDIIGNMGKLSHVKATFLMISGKYCIVDSSFKQQEHSLLELNSLILNEPLSFKTVNLLANMKNINSNAKINSHLIANGPSSSMCLGNIIINKEAQGAQGHYHSKNILLSSDTKVKSEPNLDIACDDVSCSHGVSIGTLDEDYLFYCEARGLEPNLAKFLILQGMMKESLKLVSKDYYASLEVILNSKLSELIA